MEGEGGEGGRRKMPLSELCFLSGGDRFAPSALDVWTRHDKGRSRRGLVLHFEYLKRCSLFCSGYFCLV